MSEPFTDRLDSSVDTTLRLSTELFGNAPGMPVQVRLWEGTLWPDDRPRPVTLVLRHPGALRGMFLPPTEIGLAEAYLRDDFDIEGNVESVVAAAQGLEAKTEGWLRRLRLMRELLRLPSPPSSQPLGRGRADLSGKRHSIERDRQAIAYHYDVSNDFYALWLDRRMVYSCAYFASPEEDLDTAQERKLDYLCRKLRLQPGQRLLDVGCGWGGLVLFAAQEYGVSATGITLSEPQAELANARIREAGLADRCRVEVQDYREVDEAEPFDALVSVGMFEHVGEGLLPTYFAKAWRLLKPRGVFLNHGIARGVFYRPGARRSFANTYVFPDGELVQANVTLRAAEAAGFEVRDLESLREHYAMTLRHWVSRLEAHHKTALQFVDESTYRVWRLFLSGSAHGFASGGLTVYQTLLARPDARGQSGLPLTRADWYTC
jgi:cyclopropane-fatty-acyl-phospholipid synthase